MLTRKSLFASMIMGGALLLGPVTGIAAACGSGGGSSRPPIDDAPTTRVFVPDDVTDAVCTNTSPFAVWLRQHNPNLCVPATPTPPPAIPVG